MNIVPTDNMIERIRGLLEQVPDPEIPVLSVMDLGIVRDISIKDNRVEISITPTYSGCPAMDAIALQIRLELVSHGFTEVTIRSALTPAWTTDWMSDAGKEKLLQYGIAPPAGPVKNRVALSELSPPCPHCGATGTTLLSEFGSTACKALFRCTACGEPFDYFKCH